MAMVEVENCHRRGSQHPITIGLLKKALVRRVIPFIHRRLVWTMDASQWSMSLEHFKEVDMFLADHLPCVRADHKWQMISYFFKEVVRQRET